MNRPPATDVRPAAPTDDAEALAGTAWRIADGTAIRLGRLLGAGGEGAVYELVGRPDEVVKLYRPAVVAARGAKAAAITRMGTPALLGICAWPLTTVHAPDHAAVRGILMRRITGRQEIHHLTLPSVRKRDFPRADWSFQIHVARNLAAAVGTLHQHGLVIGDINEGGFLVADDGTVRVIDCDSFQFESDGRRWLCEVGVPEYTPPELHANASFEHVTRQPNHDLFGLAVLVFKLLFQGKHPFMGRFTGAGDPEVSRFIREMRFAYGASAGEHQIEPPPFSLSLQAVSPAVAALFEQAFSPAAIAGGRPTADAWHDALGELGRSLVACASNQAHRYLRGQPACTWCGLEQASGVLLFYPLFDGDPAAGWACDASMWLAALARLPPLAPSVIACSTRSLPPTPIQPAIAAAIRRHPWQRLGAVVGVAAVGLAMAAFLAEPAVVAVALIGALVTWKLFRLPASISAELARRRSRIDATREALALASAAHARFETGEAEEGRPKASTIAGYARLRDHLQALVARYQALDGDYRQALDELVRAKREAQLHDFLEGFGLRAEKIPGIGASRLATLEYCGVTTAADITAERLRAIPGTSQAVTDALIGWRDQKAGRFRYDASRPVEPRERAGVTARFAARRQALEKEMRALIHELAAAAAALAGTRSELAGNLAAAEAAAAQAQADLLHLEGFVRSSEA